MSLNQDFILDFMKVMSVPLLLLIIYSDYPLSFFIEEECLAFFT